MDEKPQKAGTFGKVMFGVGQYDGLKYAIKSLDYKMNESVKVNVVEEVKTIAKLDHPNLVRYFMTFVKDEVISGRKESKLYIVMEFCEGGSLDDKISYGNIKEPEMFDIALQVAKGLQHMHQNNMVHLDIKPGNVVFKKKVAKICDFGLCKYIYNSPVTPSLKGTPGYIAPEFFSKKSITTKADVYSYGVLLFKMAFKIIYTRDMLKKCVEDNSTVKIEYIKLIEMCTCEDIDGRPPFDAIIAYIENNLLEVFTLQTGTTMNNAKLTLQTDTTMNNANSTLQTDTTMISAKPKESKTFYKGTLQTDKSLYEGSILDGKKHGKGKIVYSNKIVYEGEWLNDAKNGKGITTLPNGDKLEGLYINGKLNGEGSYTYADSEKYEGGFKDSEFHGYGVYTFVNGNKYEGGWKEGKKNGIGMIVYKDGKKLHCEYVNDKRVGYSLLQQPNRFDISCYADDKPTGDAYIIT